MFSTNQQIKVSSIVQKRQKFKAEIRRQFLNVYFAQKRKQFAQKQQNQLQRQQSIKRLNQLLDTYFNSQSRKQSQQIIHLVHQQFLKDGINKHTQIVLNTQRILKMFIMFPKNKYALQILYSILINFYEETFMIDDRKFSMLNSADPYEVIIERRQMTEYQQCMDVLMRTIDDEIIVLDVTKNHQVFMSEQERDLMQSQNANMHKKLKMYLACLQSLSAKVNSYMLRKQYVKKYINKWSMKLLVQHQTFQQPLLIYLNVLSKFEIPFLSYIRENKNNYNSIKYDNEEEQMEYIIVSKFFQLSVPKGNQPLFQRSPYLVTILTSNIFGNPNVKIQNILKHFFQIMTLLRVVLNFQKYYKPNTVFLLFELVEIIIVRFNIQYQDEQASQALKDQLKKVNFLTVLKEMQFLKTFSLYFMTQHQQVCIKLYKIIARLIEYCLVFDFQAGDLLNSQAIFGEIVHKVDHSNKQIVQITLKIIQLICIYAQRMKTNQLFVKLMHYGMIDTLENMVYHFEQNRTTIAGSILDKFFNRERIYEYNQYQKQLSRYDNEYQIPPRHQYYDY